MIASVNPANGETLRTFSPLTDPQIEDQLVRAEAAYRAFRHTLFPDRARWLERAAAILDADRERIARLVTLEMGKPLSPFLCQMRTRPFSIFHFPFSRLN